jgi:NADH:ubiquinone oxidoreductase subunit H
VNAAIAGVPVWLIVLIKSAILLLVVITTFAYSMLAERKIMAWM